MTRLISRARTGSHTSTVQAIDSTEGAQSLFLRMVADELTRAGAAVTWQVTPATPESPVWIHLRRPSDKTPAQGWKLHVSATIVSAEDVLGRVLPVLLNDTATFKVAASLETLSMINEGGGELSQTGKFITVYPTDDAHAVRLVTALDAATDGLAGPAILSDRPLRPGSLVHYRYGGFARMLLQQATGRVLPAIRSPDGALVPDQRLPFYGKAPWASDPFVEAGVATRPEPNLTIGGHYVILSTLAQSPSGTVYLALDLTDRRRCVLKRARRHAVTLRDGRDARDRLRHEAAVLAALAPDGYAPTPFGLVEHGGDLYLAMEDIDGETLERRVRSLATAGRRLSTDQIIAWGRELAAMLASVHARGYVYRDLKSTNVIITTDGSLRLIDFEFAHAVDGGMRPFGRGTRGYLSPQQNAGDPPAVTDAIFSLGAVLYLLATGAEPSLAPGEPVLTDRPLTLMNPLLGPRLVRLIDRCLHPDPARRFPSMQAVDAALAALDPAADLPCPRTVREGDTRARRRRYGAPARRLGDSLCSVAQPAPEGTGVAWVTRHPTAAAGPWLRDVNTGNAGTVLVLAELVATFGDPRHRATLAAGARWLMVAPPIEGDQPVGLYAGEAGVGAALLRAGQVLDDPALIHAAKVKGRLVAAMPHTSPDLFNGSAERLRFHLLLAGETSEGEHLHAATAAGDALIIAAEDAGAGAVRWTIPPGYDALSGNAYLGYAHGAAGIADALLDLFEATDDPRYLDAARGAARWLARQAVPVPEDGSGADWPDREGGAPVPPLWCHGAAGIGRFFLHLAQVSGDPADGVVARRAAVAAAGGARWANPTQCHGLAGNIELLLDMARSTGEPRWLQGADTLGRLLRTFLQERDGLLVASSESPRVFTPDYMVGYAGVAACLLRLSDPDLPHLLSRAGFRRSAARQPSRDHSS